MVYFSLYDKCVGIEIEVCDLMLASYLIVIEILRCRSKCWGNKGSLLNTSTKILNLMCNNLSDYTSMVQQKLFSLVFVLLYLSLYNDWWSITGEEHVVFQFSLVIGIGRYLNVSTALLGSYILVIFITIIELVFSRNILVPGLSYND